MTREPFSKLQFLRFLLCGPLYVTLTLLVCEALLSAATTWLVIKAGRDVANGEFLVIDLLWIFAVQCTSYAVGAVSWIFAERAGMRAFGLYMARFARDNRHYPTLLADRHAREQVEPFLTGETFHTIYRLMYEGRDPSSSCFSRWSSMHWCWAPKSTALCRSPMRSCSPS